MIDRTPRTWTDGETVTMGMLNGDLRDYMAGIQAAWDAFDPNWASTGTTQPTIANGSLAGSWIRFGRTVHFRIVLVYGSNTTWGTGWWRFTLPTAGVTGRHNFMSTVLDASTGDEWTGSASSGSGTVIYPTVPSASAGGPNRVLAPTVPFTWAAGDQLYITGTYEALSGNA